MSTITTLRPSATSSFIGWTAVPGGTLHGVTSDDSDATYALWGGSGGPLVLQTPLDAPPLGERRHQVRVRARGEDGSAWWAVRLQTGALTGGASAEFAGTPETRLGSWGFGAPHDGNTILAAHILAQSPSVKITEIYVDVDTREAPTFTGQVLDSTGAVSIGLTDTNAPRLRATAIDSDDLSLRQYRYWVSDGSGIVWDTGILAGSPTIQQTEALENGAYTARFQIWTTLGANTPYASSIEEIDFTVTVEGVAIPNDPTITQIPDSPLMLIEVCAPYIYDLDFGTAHIEIQRVDCVGSESERVTSLAILGPFTDADQCREWTDYTIPRTGIGASCAHPAEECCSFYRARTVGRRDGGLVISAWSDVRDTGIPRGLIFPWPGTDAGIPTGWKRTTYLDGQYPRSVPSGEQPGLVSGDATHSHSMPAHQHATNHAHIVTGNTSAAVGTVTSTPNTAGTLGVPATHTHTRSAVNSTNVSSGFTAAAIGTVANDPNRLEVIFVESDGTPAGIPSNALGIAGDVSLAGWTDYANATGRFLKGAAPGGDGGTTAASALPSHTHSLGAHTHTGTGHTHTSPNVGNVNGSLALTAGAVSATYSTTHSHPVTVGSTDTAALISGGAGNTDAVSPDEPPFVNVRVKQNTSGGQSLPVGIIGLWGGSLGTIPQSWKLCDGTNGTPDLLDRFPKGATSSIGVTGGSENTHTHTAPTHTHTTTGHTHTMTIGAQTGATSNVLASATISVANSTHTHTGSATDSTTPTVSAAGGGTMGIAQTLPPYTEMAFVQLTEEPQPEPDPEVVCLSWPDAEHLLRTEGPDGAMWAPVIGKFAWDVDKPITVTTGVNGTRFGVAGAPGERSHKMTAAVESEQDLTTLLAVLARPLVLISPSDSTEVWAAPVATSIKVVKVRRIRQVTAEFIGTGPQPGPQLADV